MISPILHPWFQTLSDNANQRSPVDDPPDPAVRVKTLHSGG
jgi:hypothetical protein